MGNFGDKLGIKIPPWLEEIVKAVEQETVFNLAVIHDLGELLEMHQRGMTEAEWITQGFINHNK